MRRKLPSKDFQKNPVMSKVVEPHLEIGHQSALVYKINVFLIQQGRPQIEDGYCHGLTLLWLKRMARKRENEFYQMVNEIINCPDDRLQMLTNDIEKILKSIDKKQNPQNYFWSFFSQPRQLDVDVLLKAEKQISYDRRYTFDSLEMMLELFLNGDMIYISSKYSIKVKGYNHAIGLYKKENMYYLYDPNSFSVEARIFHSTDIATAEILKCLYSVFKIRIPPSFHLIIKPTRYLHETAALPHILAQTIKTFNKWANYFYFPENNAHSQQDANTTKISGKLDKRKFTDEPDGERVKKLRLF